MTAALIALKDLLGGWRALGFAVAALLLALACAVQQARIDHLVDANKRVETRTQAAQVQAERAARAVERKHAEELSAIAGAYETEKRHAQDAADRVVAELRTGNVRLRERWQGCHRPLPAVAAAASQPDAATDDRSESAGRIVRAAAECDATVRALQAVLRSERGETP